MSGVVKNVGAVIIGRNEGPRIARCVRSVIRATERVIYVDSGSQDDSVALVTALDVPVLRLEKLQGFSAARARNEGFKQLLASFAGIEYVQFVDGDSELLPGWVSIGAAFLASRPEVGVVSGRVRERHPEQSVYNLLCDIEWDRPVGEAKACGGIAMVRAAAFDRLKGFREDLVAGEEPELCIRLRANGWRIWHLDSDMALHDAAMTRFGQWWRRAIRAGYAFAAGAALHGARRHYLREALRPWFWAAGIPGFTLVSMVLSGPWAAGLLLIYPVQVLRLALSGGRTRRENWANAWFLVLGKFPESYGQALFLTDRWLRRQSHLIEYK